jgi:glutamate formiminotransferase / 5-formyltetrahydrofolate cyclo-ligase
MPSVPKMFATMGSRYSLRVRCAWSQPKCRLVVTLPQQPPPSAPLRNRASAWRTQSFTRVSAVLCHHAVVLECVINVSEGRDLATLATIARAAGNSLLDVHRDADHHRSVFTLGGEDDQVEGAARELASAVVAHVDISSHIGAHPRIGALDVVPFVALDDHGEHGGGHRFADGALQRSLEARDRFTDWAGEVLKLPCFSYGPERSLPEVRRGAWRDLLPDRGPDLPHPSAGAAAVGARRVLVAYNLWLATPDLGVARQVAADIRSPDLRTLGLAVGREVQVSCNLVAPWALGPAWVYDAVAARATISRAELVGLIPHSLLDELPRSRWERLDLDPARTIEARLEQPPSLVDLALG